MIGPASKCVVDPSGKWRLEVNLDTAEFHRAKGTWTLSIVEEKNRKNQQEYTGILPGDVILVAGWEGQGVPANPKEFESGIQFAHDKTAVRFLDLNRAAARKDGTTASELNWVPWPQGETEVGRYSSLSLRLAHMLALKKCPEITQSEHLGIVLAPLWLVEQGLDVRRLTTVKRLGNNDGLWTWITESTSNAQAARSKTLIFNKRHGIIDDVPPIRDYDPALTGLRDAFDPKKPPREWFTFAGAIWSFDSATASTPPAQE